jgi:hypothetical protein
LFSDLKRRDARSTTFKAAGRSHPFNIAEVIGKLAKYVGIR